MDAQTRIRDTAALVALVQCLVRLRGARGHAPSPSSSHAPEVLDENRFLAARDGIRRAAARPAPRPLRARPPAAWRRWSTPAGRTPARWAASASSRCSPTSPATRAPTRQRAIASEPAGLRGLVHTLEGEFSPPRPRLAAAA